LAPNLEGLEKYGYLPKASTLCGACEEVCPVQIPIPHMLLELRDEANRAGVIKEPASWDTYAFGARNPAMWRAGLAMLPIASKVVPHPMKSGRSEFHDLPKRRGQSFRSWWKNRPELPKAEATLKTSGDAPTTTEEPSQVEGWDLFGARLGTLGGRLGDMQSIDLSDKVCYIDPDAANFAHDLKIGSRTDDVWSADVGITLGVAVLESGSVVTKAGEGRARLASLAPPVHIALVKELVETVKDAVAISGPQTSVIATGTSRTADIEGVLVRGVHGPRELIVVRI
jgi:L-lactate utilization protein LutB